MQNSFTGMFRSFLARNLTAEVRELYALVAIMDFAVSAVMIFEPIYLYSLGYSLVQILWFWLAVYVLYFLTVPLGAHIAQTRGFEHTIFYSSIFLILYYLCLFGTAQYAWLLGAAVIMLVIQKVLFWPAYHANFAHYSANDDQGREISNLMVLDSLVYILGPLMGGIIIELAGFKVLFIVVSFFILVSNIPTLMTPEKFVPKKFPYADTYRALLKPQNRRSFFASLGYGEELLALVIWPIFIFIMFKDYFSIGALAALSTLVATLLAFYVGRTTDQRDKHQVLRLSTMFCSASWWLRLLASTSWGVFLVDALSRISKQSLSIPYVSLTYTEARQGSVMHTVVFYETALVLGKIIAAILGIILLTWWGSNFSVIFVLAGLMTLLYSLR